MMKNWTSNTSLTFCLANAAMYVLSLYLIPAHVRVLPRENKINMKYRMFAASIATFLSISLFVHYLPIENVKVNAITALGLRMDNLISSIVVTFALMCTFYLGPLVTVCQYLILSLGNEIRRDGTYSALSTPQSLWSVIKTWCLRYKNEYGSLILFRNLLFAPLTEEVVFRAVIVPSMFLGALTVASNTHPVSSFNIALVSPVWFGLAHLHHFMDKARQHVPLVQNLTVTLIQLVYTSIFGFMAALLFMRTGNIVSPVLSHVMCNVIGLPDIGFMYSSSDINNCNEYSSLHKYRHLLLALHALGLVFFALLLYPLTEHLANGYSPYWR